MNQGAGRDAFTRFLEDGRLCMSNNAAERELRAVALGRKNWTFAGSDDEGASYCPSDNLLINQADFAADREMTGVETCGFWRPAGCLRVRHLSPVQAMARRDMDDRRTGHLPRSCAVPWTGLRSTPALLH
jgi:Transposase IS66 family